MSNERIDLTQFEDMVAEEECLNLGGANGYDMCDMARTLIAELKRCYEEIDKLRGYLRVWSPVADLTIEECSKPQE